MADTTIKGQLVGGGTGGGSTDFTGLTDTPGSYSGQKNKVAIVNNAENALEFVATSSFGGGGGSTTFTGLTDTPSSYAGQAGKVAVVNSGETALEFLPTSSAQYTLLEADGTQTVNGGSSAFVAYDTEISDDGNWHDNVTNNSRITVDYTGKVHLNAFVDTGGVDTTVNWAFSIVKNGSTTIANSGIQDSSAGSEDNLRGATLSIVDDCSPNDYYEVNINASTSGQMTVTVSTFQAFKLGTAGGGGGSTTIPYAEYTGNSLQSLTGKVTDIVWDTKVKDDNDDYSGGIYTVPEDGVLEVVASLNVTNTAGAFLSVYVGGTRTRDMNSNISGQNFDTTVGTAMLDVTAGQQVSIRSDATTTVEGGLAQTNNVSFRLIPHTISGGAGGGTSELPHQQFYLTADQFGGGDGNLETVFTNFTETAEKYQSYWSETSGIFSTTEAGVYRVGFSLTAGFGSGSPDAISPAIQISTDGGSNWTTIARFGIWVESGATRDSGYNSGVFAVTNPSQFRLRYVESDIESGMFATNTIFGGLRTQLSLTKIDNISGGSGTASSIAILEDVKAQGTNGGGVTANTWVTRSINTEAYDPDGIVTLSNNQFTLQSGSYTVRCDVVVAMGAGGTEKGMLRLFNVTDNNVIDTGNSLATFEGGTYENGNAVLNTAFALTGSTAISLEDRRTVSYSAGMGAAANITGVSEKYLNIEITKLS
jgi:hypothetical protein